MEFAELMERYRLRLNDQQCAAVQAVDRPTLLLAVPGSGKTTVLVARLGYLRFVKEVPAESILTMTYTVAAARDMKQRFAAWFGEEAAKGMEFRTINGVCAAMIRSYERIYQRTAFSLLADAREKTALLREVCRSQGQEYPEEGTLRALETAITYAKNQMLKGEELEEVPVEGIQNFPTCFQSYNHLLRQREQMDYDDQMVYALQILRQCPELLQRLRQRYRYLSVDEAQDTSKIQHELIRLLAGEHLFMVGDEDQSIYSFRAAYPKALMEFQTVYPKGQVLYLEQNYRSRAPIVQAADRFIQANPSRHPKHMKATRGPGPQVRQLEVYDRQAQYQYLKAVAEDCGVETAVLYRDNDSALPLIDLLDRSHIPYRCRQVESFFFTHRVVRDISDIIRCAYSPCDAQPFMNIYYKLGAGISREAAEKAAQVSRRKGIPILEVLAGWEGLHDRVRMRCRSLRAHMKELQTERGDKAVARIVRQMGYGNYVERNGGDLRKADILEALGAQEPSAPALLDRLQALQEIVSQAPAQEEGKFILSTIHSSKGLEYDRVILMDVVDGLLPQTTSQSKDKRKRMELYEEERRLFYVAMTRAREELAIFTFRKPTLESAFAKEVFSVEKPPAIPQYRPGPKEQARVAAAQGFPPGCRVLHRTFGLGTLLTRNGDIGVIDFDSGDSRKISLSVAIRAGQLKEI